MIVENLKISKIIAENIKKYYNNNKIIVVSNPVDIITYQISKILDITEGLENRFLKYATEKSIDSMLLAIKNKRYTLSKLRHCLIHILLNII